jgi:polyisoprenoid-binding protein YceI
MLPVPDELFLPDAQVLTQGELSMHRRILFAPIVALFALALIPALRAADEYNIDPVHSCISFQVQHFGISYIHGRFNEFSGEFTIDKDDPSKSSITLTIKAESVDTNNKQRDGHLRSADFFNVKQFPSLTFKSKSFKAVEGGYEVTGDLTMHGETKSITFKLSGGKEIEMPMKKGKRIGYWADLKINRSDFGMNKMLEGIGDTVYISVAVEGAKK